MTQLYRENISCPFPPSQTPLAAPIVYGISVPYQELKPSGALSSIGSCLLTLSCVTGQEMPTGDLQGDLY